MIFRVWVKIVHNTGDQVSLGKIEQGVENIDSFVWQLQKFVWVQFFDFMRLQKVEPMNCNKNVAKAIDFQQIAIQVVKPKTTNGKDWIVFEIVERFRISDLSQTFHDQIKSHGFKCRWLIDCKCVIHIISKIFDFVEAQISVDKNSKKTQF